MGEMQMNLQVLPEQTYAAGESIIVENEQAGGLFFLSAGTVSVSKDGIEIHKVSTPGAIFGEMSYLLDTQPTATVTAETDCTMKVVHDRSSFILENPDMALYIAKILAGRLDSVVRYLVDIKAQFPDHEGHLGMMDEILDSIINKHPRQIERRLNDQDLVDD